MGRFLWEREDQVRVSLRSVEGCGGNGQKNSVNGDCLHFILLIVSVASVVLCWQQNPKISLSRGVVLSRSTFRLVIIVFSVVFAFLAPCD